MQRKNAAREAIVAAPPALDLVRLEQLLDLHRGLLLSEEESPQLPDRLVHAVATLLGVAGAALGVVQDGLYRVLAASGLDADYTSTYDRTSARDGILAGALRDGRPVVRAEAERGPHPLTTVVLPLRGRDVVGALHIVERAARPLSDADVHIARVLAAMAATALSNAARCRRLAEHARLKSDALSSMAHDLRSPLNALVGYANLLGDGAFGPLLGEQREVAATLERQALELIDLLGATLDVARLENGRLPLRIEDVDLAEMVRTLQGGTFARGTREGTVGWRVAPHLPRLRSDRVKVKEIVQNLVDNALKHGTGGRVDVEVAPAESGRDAVHVTVRDTGPGIAPDVLPHLFERFGPGDGRGTGFGLYIVRVFVEALGGRVVARSIPGQGTAITVELPLASPAR
jgi:signal transduction histidine kinase